MGQDVVAVVFAEAIGQSNPIVVKLTDTFTKLANPAALPAGNSYGAAFDPTSTYLAIAHFTTPFVTIYKMDQKAYLGGNHIINVTGALGVTAAGYAKEAGAATETKQIVRIWRTGS